MRHPALDGVFLREGEKRALVFHEGPAPSRESIAVIAERVDKRMTRWLRRRRLVDERPAEERSNEPHAPSALEACLQMSLFGGTFLRSAEDGTPWLATKTKTKAKKKRKQKSAANADPKPPPHAPRTALGAGLLDPSGAWIPRADLLRRIYLEDVLACPPRPRRSHEPGARLSARRDACPRCLACPTRAREGGRAPSSRRSTACPECDSGKGDAA